MILPNSPLVESLWIFANNFVDLHEKSTGGLPIIEKDDDWPSACQQDDYDENNIHWRPVISEIALSFENIESALEISLHPDIKTYFSTFFSESINATCEDGELSLLFAWNNKDFYRLQENIIGHILMKKRLKQENTIFFGVTNEDDMILSINNETGAVWVERVGCKAHKKLADSLNDFIRQLTPAL
ncbi:MAG: SecY-interacting protein [Alteromonadaceae bacterium]|jgi:SecY interacting protein Syd|tara:strand:- start:1423 stop:1980 length:558 start_codon:yes stop_codon:yes gene_type:complete